MTTFYKHSVAKRLYESYDELFHSSTYLDPDQQLMLDVKNDDPIALKALIDRWKRPLMAYFYRSISDHGMAEDLTQQTFIKIYQARIRYEARATFSTYLFSVARNCLLNSIRQQSRKPLIAQDPHDFNHIADPSNPKHHRIEQDVQKALQALPEPQRSCLLLLTQNELSYAEIAEITELSLDAVKAHIYRARKTLRNQLKDLL